MMSSSTDFISDEGVIKTSAGRMSAPRLRKSQQNSNSIYVPPPLRKRKTSFDLKKNSSKPSAEKCKVPDVSRSIALHINSPPTSQTNKSKKCENSYLLFGLEDKSNQPKSIDKSNQENEPKDRISTKDGSMPQVKKCDNSYLLFSSAPEEPSHFSDTPEKTWKKGAPSRTEGNDYYDPSSHRNSENLPRVKPLESMLVPYLPEELSCGVGSLSMNNKSLKTNAPQSRESKDSKLIKQPSQKKCDNSYFLFDDDDTDAKYGKTPYREKPQVNSSLPPCDRLSQPVNSDKSLQSPSFVSSQNEEICCRKERARVTGPKLDEGAIFGDELLEDVASTKPDVQSNNFDVSDSIEDYVVEIYDFPKSLRTQDMMTIFSVYAQDGFFIKWVDDTHALGVFTNPFLVADVLKKKFDQVSIRSLQNATPASVDIASTIPVPSGSRPRTCPSLARRLVSGALGLRVSVSDEIRLAEKKMLQDAKEERRLAAKQREEAWEGTLRSNLTT